MLNLAAKLLFALAGFALLTAAAYGVAVSERSGIVLFVALGVLAALTGLAATATGVPDIAPPPSDAAAPERRAETSGAPARGTAWPLAVALAAAVVAVGAAVGAPVVLAGVLLAVAAGTGWFVWAWRQSPGWSPRLRDRVAYRLTMPVGLPLGTFVLVLIIAVSLSRVLLAASKNVAVWVALLVAVVILAVFSVLSLRPRVSPPTLVALAAVGALSVIASGIAGAARGEREFHHAGGEHEEPIELVARETAFDKQTITVDSGHKVKMVFENEDDGIYHNVAIYDSDQPDARALWNGRGFPGDGEITYEFEPPRPGRYIFVCDFHISAMKGQFVVR